MSIPNQGTLIGARFSTLILDGERPVPTDPVTGDRDLSTATLVIRGAGDISVEHGRAYIEQGVFTPNIVSTGVIEIIDGASPGKILRGGTNPVGRGYWDHDYDDRINGGITGDINFQNGSFGIGVSFPMDMLHVKDSIRTDEDINFTNVGSNISFPTLLTVNTDKFFFHENSMLGIGVSAIEALDVMGNIRLSQDFIKGVQRYRLPDIPMTNDDILVVITESQTVYNKTLDYPTVQGHLDMNNSGRMINLQDPLHLQDAVTLNHLQNFIQGFDPQESVKDKDLNTPPGSVADRDRYIVASVATGAWVGQENNIAQWNQFLSQWDFSVPDQGTLLLVEDENKKYIYTGSMWVLFDTLVAHGELQELDQDQHLQYQLLAGRAGGQIMNGGINASDNFTIYSTSHPTRGDVLFQPDGGNLSIGTTNPQELVHVRSQDTLDAVILVDTRNTNTDSKVVLRNNGVANNSWEITYQSSTEDFVIQDTGVGERFVIENGASGAIRFNSGGDEWMRLDGGYLGLASSGPTERLTIGDLDNELDETILLQANDNAKLKLSSNLTNLDDSETSIIELCTKNETKQSLIAIVGTDGQFATDTHQDSLYLGAGASGVMTDIQFGTNDLVRMTIKENGNVGIDEDEPNAQLVLNQNLEAHDGLTIGSTQSVGIKVGQSSTAYMDMFWNYNLSENQAYSEITNKFAINPLVFQSTGGSVGIGVTQPMDRLDVFGNIRLSGTLNRGDDVFTLPPDSDTLVGTTATQTLENKSLEDETVYFVDDMDHSKILKVNLTGSTTSTTSTLIFEQTDNRDITFFDNTDTVVGVTTAAFLTNKNLTGNELNNFLTSEGGYVTLPPVGVTGDTVIYSIENQTLRNKTLIDPVIVGGIATSAGSFVLTDRIRALDDRGITFQDNANNLSFVVNDGGWVSYGTTYAQAQLHVIGDMVRFDSNLQVNTDTLYVAVTSTNVGINTNNPEYDLHVNGDGKFNNNLIVDGNLTVNGTQTVINSTIVSIEDSLAKYADGNPADTLDIGFYGCYVETGVTKNTGFFRDATDGKYRLYTGLEVPPNSNVINIGATGYTKAEFVVGTLDVDNINHSGNLLFNTNQTIFTASGDVGIGTVTPTQTLHVNGTFRVANEVYVKDNKIGLHKSDAVTKVDINGSIRAQATGSTVLTGMVDPDGTTTVTGAATSFLSQIVPGDRLTIGAETRTVKTVSSDSMLTVDTPFTDIPITTGTRLPAMFILEDSSAEIQFILRDDGFLGLGTTCPVYPLQVDNPNPTNWSTRFKNGESTVFLGHASGLGANIQTGTLADTSYALKVSNDTHPLLRLQNDNKLGIGTDTPAELLHLQGSAAGDGALLANAKIGVWEGNTSYFALTHNDTHANTASYAIKQLNSGDTTLNSADTKDIHFAINDVDKMVLKPTCRLGIGTSDPTDTLHVWGGSMVTGNLKVSGNLEILGVIQSVSTSEIRVQDSIFKFADGNTADLIDIGFYAQYNDGIDRYTGLYRNDADKKWILFTNLEPEPGTTQVNDSHASYEYGHFVTGGLDIHSSMGTTGQIFFLDENGTTVNEIRSTPDAVTFGTSGIFVFESEGNQVMTIDENSNITVSGAFNIADLQVNNSLTIDYDLFVTGEAAFGNLSVSGNFSVDSFGVSGDGTFSGNVNAGGDLIVDGGLTVKGAISFPSLSTNSLTFNVTNITMDLSLGTTHSIIVADATTGPITVTLPESHDDSIPNFKGNSFIIIKEDNTSNAVIVKRSSNDLIDGTYTQHLLTQQYDRVQLTNIGGKSLVGLWFTM